MGSCSLRWPQVTGMTDEALQQQINDAILTQGNVQSMIARAAQVMSAADPLVMDWEGMLTGDVLSLRISARGPVTSLRATETVTCVNIDLRTG